MRKFVALAFVVLLVVGTLRWESISPVLGQLLGTAQTAEAGSTSVTVVLPATPEQRHRYVVLDPSTSTDTAFRDAMKSILATEVESYVPPKPAVTKDGVAALTGLVLVVRLVGTTPLAYGQPEYRVSIPSVPELQARPDMTAVGALDPGGPYEQWKDAEAEWSVQYDAAVAAGQAAAETLRGIDLNLDEQSAITAAVAALTLVAPPQGDVAYLVMSDLDENENQQPAAFGGHPMVVIQPDPFGDIARWNSLFQAFGAWATANGASGVDRVRPEVADAVISQFVKGE